MQEVLTGALWGGLAGVIVGLTLLIWVLLMPRKACPKCGAKLARFRKPSNLGQALWGGWTCHGCGTELNRKGKMIEQQT